MLRRLGRIAAGGRAGAAVAVMATLSACVGIDRAALPRLTPVDFQQLPGWWQDRVTAAVPVFLRSCARFWPQPDSAPLDPAAPGWFGTVGDWRPLCRQAAVLPPGNDHAARAFFETNFQPVIVDDAANGQALVTGYYEVELEGSRHRRGRFQTPVYRRPPDLVAGHTYLDRAAIENGALARRGLELLWLADPDDLLVLQTQGSGRVRLTDGSVVHLMYDTNNSRPYLQVENRLKERGFIPPDQFSNASVRAWMRQNKAEARAIRRENPGYVFFREIRGDSPVGAQGAVLTPERSLAVDHKYLPLGIPLWLDAQDWFRPVAVQRMVVAQDAGDTISGPDHADLYWGSGSAGQRQAADFYASGRYYIMLPRKLTAPLLAWR